MNLLAYIRAGIDGRNFVSATKGLRGFILGRALLPGHGLLSESYGLTPEETRKSNHLRLANTLIIQYRLLGSSPVSGYNFILHIFKNGSIQKF